ncbi:GGDEF domain-containing protein [Pelagibacterium xiamenense]|uniref:GGDEF domain-containing protein n=1 Tax=Pelagibacterium xiamenense TaxID=2901140 RepID=UPI001E5111CB|nr:GGDEF domain-containing protein [Pelagibacterium xiamenense]MCD7060394.1 GGDEF domain-containing protein [Pelagibacterium xiamenense]
MVFDYISVLVAVGAASAALCVTLVMSWVRQRESAFLASWAAAMGIVVAAIASFAVYDSGAAVAWMLAGCLLLTTGLILSYGGLVQFRDGVFPVRGIGFVAAAVAVPMIAAFVLGYTGAVIWLVNLIATGVLCFIGWQYWRLRPESVVTISAIAGLHFILAVSFFLCFVMGLVEAPLYTDGGMPDNWAEKANLVCSIIAVTGIGGLLNTMHQERIAGLHRAAALTDPLTGLNNRRALFERFRDEAVPEGTALVIFDLDDFKALNDRYGHGFGDTVLERFAELISSNVRAGDLAVRLGGEEFALVLPETNAAFAFSVAERIRNAMAQTSHGFGDDEVFCTVSAGVAFAHKPGISLDMLMRKADNALYLSKRNGRNRVTPLKSSAA